MKFRSVLLATAALVVLVGALPAWAQHAQYYILDGFGGIHAGDGAPAISPAPPYFGWNIARDLVYVPVGTATATGDGVLVLDGFGGVHPGGALIAAPPSTEPPYFGFDIAQGITYRDVPPRANGVSNGSDFAVSSTSYASVLATNIIAPDDGMILATATAEVWCAAGATAGRAVGWINFGVDNVAGIPGFAYRVDVPDCSDQFASKVVTVTFPIFAPAGPHAIHFLARNDEASANAIRLEDRTLAAVFIDQNDSGVSRALENEASAGPAGRLP